MASMNIRNVLMYMSEFLSIFERLGCFLFIDAARLCWLRFLICRNSDRVISFVHLMALVFLTLQVLLFVLKCFPLEFLVNVLIRAKPH